jgi:hypothetical protein
MSKYYLLLLIIFLTVVIGLIVNKFTKEHFFVETRKDVQKYIDNKPIGNFWWDRYEKYNSEVNYLNDVHTSKFFGIDNDLLILNRCIRHDSSVVPSDMYQLKDWLNVNYLNSTLFPHQVDIFDVNSEKDIQEKIIKLMKEFYDKSIKKDSDGTKTLNGPVYVLLHNAPNKDTSKKSRLLMYILYPTYNKKGEFVFKNWENVRCNMEPLLNHWHHQNECYTNIGNSNLPGGCTNLNKPYKNRCDDNLIYGMLYTVNTSSDALKVIAGENAIKNTVNIHSHFLSSVRPYGQFTNNCSRINKNPNKKVNSVPVQKYVDDRFLDVFYNSRYSQSVDFRRIYTTTPNRDDDTNSNGDIYNYFILYNPSKFAIKLYSDNNLRGAVKYLVGNNTNTPQKLEVPSDWKGQQLSYRIIPRKNVPKQTRTAKRNVVNIKYDIPFSSNGRTFSYQWKSYPQGEWPFAQGIGKKMTGFCIHDKKSVIRLYEKPNFKGRSYGVVVGGPWSYGCIVRIPKPWYKNVGSFKIYPK